METEARRFTVRKTLPMLWEVRDTHRFVTEWVLFADYGLGHVRGFMSNEFYADQPAARPEMLRMLVERASRAGVRHSFRPPPRMAPLTYYQD